MLPHPIIKWAGGKTTLLPYLRNLLPPKIGTYHEPFIGGAALFFSLAGEGRFDRAVINDWNSELVTLYRIVRDDSDALMAFLREREKEYTLTPKDLYYQWRTADPTTLTDVQRAGRFIFLNKAGFNGLYRVNKSGGFNVPWSQRPTVRTFDEENIGACSRVLRNGVDIRHGDFTEACQTAAAGDCVYFDPPYVPLTPTSDFTSYTSDKFTLRDQERLAALFTQLAERGVTVLLSNSDTPAVRELYAGWELHEVKVRRNINSKGDGRGTVGELIVVGRRGTRTVQGLGVTKPAAPIALTQGVVEFDEEPNPAGYLA